MTEHPTDEFEAFALGDLDVQRASAVVEHADRCADCARELAHAVAGVAALAAADAAGSSAVAGSFERAHAGRVGRTPWLVAVLATAAALAMFGWNVQLRQGSTHVPEATVIPISALVHSHFVHHALTGTGGNAKVIQAIDGSWVYLIADGLTAGREYQLSVNGSPLGSTVADRSGRTTAYWERGRSRIATLELTGPADAVMRWSERP